MKKLVIEPSKSTPFINFDADQNNLLIQGESYPENTAEFYQPVFNWLNQYVNEIEDQEVMVNVELIYFNSSTSKVLMDFFDILDLSAQKNKISVNWIYDAEDEDNLEYGEDFQEDLKNLTFKFSTK
ncbi:MAG: DUF1987 domain-containing protein [Deltaproteobacteria bacterium]|jgi:hypothetical protein|nr:DUF1987 domain-containing protein [Deltaproteobacteria bacterium]